MTASASYQTAGIKTSDPRIISPEIKVVYPSGSVHKDLQITEPQTTTSVAEVLSASSPQTTEVLKEIPAVTTQTTAPQVISEVTEKPKTPTLKDTLKEHAGLFIAVALISVGIGLLIGKKL